MAEQIRGVDMLYLEGTEPIAGQTNCTLNMTCDNLDTTTKDNIDWKSALAGLKAWSSSLDVVEMKGDKGRAQIEFMKKFNAHKTINVNVVLPGQWVFEGEAAITGVDIAGDMNSAATGSYQFSGAGAPTFYFVPFIKKVTGTGTTVTIELTESTTTINKEAVLTDAIKIGGVAPSAATLENGKITCTVTSVAGGEEVIIAADALTNGMAVQISEIKSKVEAATE